MGKVVRIPVRWIVAAMFVVLAFAGGFVVRSLRREPTIEVWFGYRKVIAETDSEYTVTVQAGHSGAATRVYNCRVSKEYLHRLVDSDSSKYVELPASRCQEVLP